MLYSVIQWYPTRRYYSVIRGRTSHRMAWSPDEPVEYYYFKRTGNDYDNRIFIACITFLDKKSARVLSISKRWITKGCINVRSLVRLWKTPAARLNPPLAVVFGHSVINSFLDNAMNQNLWLTIGITMPKALFFENVLIAWKPSLDVAGLQKVIPKNISEI